MKLSRESGENLKSKGFKKPVFKRFFNQEKSKKVSKAQIDFWIASSQKAQKTFWKSLKKVLTNAFECGKINNALEKQMKKIVESARTLKIKQH